jgi:hypothetical protein
VRRLALTICALILGAGFTPVLPSTVDRPAAPAPVRFVQQSTVDAQFVAEPIADPPSVITVPVTVLAAQLLPDGRHVGAVTGRAPPFLVA